MAVRAAVFFWIVNKVLENAHLTKRAKTLVDCMCVSEVPGAQGTLQKDVKVFLLNFFCVLWRLFLLFTHSYEKLACSVRIALLSG